MSREENCKVADKALNAADCHQKALVVLFLNLVSDFFHNVFSLGGAELCCPKDHV